MLEYEKQKWDNIKKTGDFLDFIEDPKVNIDGWMIHNIDTAKSGFWVAANVNFDFDVKELIEKAPQIAANEVSTVTRLPQEVEPAATKPVYRCFVALDDWHPGQIVNFEPDFWSGWKKGDAAFFDWRNTPHTTANSGIENRPFLKITGTIENDSYITESRKSGVVEQRTVR